MNPRINLKLIWALLALTILGFGGVYVQYTKELDALKAEPLKPSPGFGLSPEPALGEASSPTDVQAIKKDPFKEFLEAKAKNPQAQVNPTPDPHFVPGTDPFKAKLEEQKNAAHSAVSPFKN
jgi:hypothetical protein